MKDNKRQAISVLFTVLCCALFVPFIMNNLLNGDESRTLIECKKDLVSIVAWSARDYHPPLYYFLLNFVLKITKNSIVIAKLLSLIPIWGCIILGLVVIKKEFGIKAMICWDILVCSVPGIVRNSVTLRMYSWAIFLVLLASIMSWYIVKTDKACYWGLFTAFSVAASYTHYYAFISAAYLFAVLLLTCIVKKDRKVWKKYIISAVLAIVLYLPWLIQFVLQTQKVMTSGFWAKDTNIFSLLSATFNSHFNFSWIIWCVAIIIFICLGIYNILKRGKLSVEAVWHIGNILSFPVIFIAVYFFSIVWTPIIVPRYLLIPLIMLLFEMAIVAEHIDKRIFLCAVLFFMYAGIVEYRYQLDLIEISSHNDCINEIEENAIVCTSNWSTKDILNAMRPDLQVYYCAGQKLDNVEGNISYIADVYISEELEDKTKLVSECRFLETKFLLYSLEE